MHGCSHRKKLLIAGLLGALGSVLTILLAPQPVWAQNQELLDVIHPGGLMRLIAPEPVVVSLLDDDEIEYWARPAGRFQFLTGPMASVGGDPTRAGDEDKAICSRATVINNGFIGYTSRIQFSIDRMNPNPDVEGREFDLFDAMNGIELVGDPADLPEYWPIPLSATTRGVTGTAVVPVDDEEELAGPVLEVYHNFEMVGDGLMIELVVTNTTNSRHYVGVRLALDCGFGGSTAQDGVPIILADGTVIDSERVFPDATLPHVGMPAGWLANDDPSNPLMSVKGIIDADEIHRTGFASQTAGLPDALEFGLWNRISGSWFNFQPNLAVGLTGENWGVGVKWEEVALEANASRRYVTYLAFGASVADYNPPFATMSYAPHRLQQQTGDDPSTPDVTEAYYLTDGEGRSPFPVSVYVDNFGTSSLLGGTVAINPPEGLTLFPTDQPRTWSLGVVPRNTLIGASWTLSAAAARPGVATVGLNGPRGRVVDRDIQIPAVPVLNPRPSPNGLEMISIPYEFTNTDAEHVFQSLGGLQPGQLGSLIRWDPEALLYRWFPHPQVTNVATGYGYWLLNRAGIPVVMPPDADPLPMTTVASLPVKRGWNQIGNPFTLPLRFDTLEVIGPYGGQWSLREAVGRGLLQPVLFSYDPTLQEYEWEQDLLDMRLDPYEGYWLLAYDELTLVMPPPGTYSVASAGPEVQRISNEPSGWQATLVVAGAGQRAEKRVFGVSSAAQDDLDVHDVAAPPAPLGATMQAAFVSPQGGTACLVDLKADEDTEKTWYLQVTSSQPQTGLMLSWPDLSAMPDHLIPILEDTATGARCYLRTTARYRFEIGESGSRLFKIIVRPKTEAAPMVSQLRAQATAGGNCTITYALSAPATVEVQIRNIAGIVIRQVVSGQVCAAGVNTILWNGRSASGSRVPAGRYLCQISARSPETGQSSNVVTTFEVTR